MEQFSRAYVKAVAAAAGCTYQRSGPDVDVVDVILKRKSNGGVRRSPQLDLQLKATYQNCVQASHVAFPLDIPTYDNLRATNFGVPRVLVVVVMNANVVDWTLHSESALALHKCGYWMSLAGMAPSPNVTSVTVHIPRSQVFDPAGLDALFDRLENGQDP